jgi:hypothetical protein
MQITAISGDFRWYLSCVQRVFFAALLFLLAPACSRSDQLSLDSSWDWGGTLAVRGALVLQTMRLFWGCGDCTAAVKEPAAGLFTLGMYTPWFRAGSLANAGLLRMANNPLGFSAQSEVFGERTGLRLERSLDAGRVGLLLTPLPDTLGLFCLNEPQAAPSYGCFLNMVSPEGSGAEGFLWLTQPDAESSGEEWFPSTAPFPGGKLLVAGTRFRISVPGVSCIAALGTSRGEQVGPGGFWQLRASAFGNAAYAALLVAGMDGMYRSPRGTGFREAASFAAAGGFSNQSGSAGVRYSLLLDRPGPAPRPCRSTREVFEARIERVLADAGDIEISLCLKGEKRVSRDEEGARQDTSRYAAAVKGGGRGFQAVWGIELLEPDGLALFLTAACSLKRRLPHISLESRWESRLRESPVLTELLTLRLSGPGSSLGVQTGIERLPLSRSPMDVMKCMRLKAWWSVSASPGSRQDHLPLEGEAESSESLALHQLDQGADVLR